MPGYGSHLVKVFLLDDHDIVRRGLRDLLTAATDIQVVGDAGSTQGAAQAILELGADVMLLDLQLQDGTGIEVCRAVRAVSPPVRGLLLTSVSDDEALAASVLAGASGYIVKANRGADIIGAVRRLGGGRSMTDPALAEPVVSRLRSQLDTLSLTEHEREVLGHVLDGRTDARDRRAHRRRRRRRGTRGRHPDRSAHAVVPGPGPPRGRGAARQAPTRLSGRGGAGFGDAPRPGCVSPERGGDGWQDTPALRRREEGIAATGRPGVRSGAAWERMEVSAHCRRRPMSQAVLNSMAATEQRLVAETSAAALAGARRQAERDAR